MPNPSELQREYEDQLDIEDAINARTLAVSQSGVQPHSRACAQQRYYIFASHKPKHCVMQYMYNAEISFKDLTGQYTMQDGEVVKETSYIVNSTDVTKLSSLLEGQESILALMELQGGKRDAHLVYLQDGGDIDYIGKFTQVSQEEALEDGNYTYDDYLGAYFICKLEEEQA